MRKDKIRVFCVDDHEFLIDGIEAKFKAELDIEVVGRLGSAEHLIEKCQQLSPRVVLLDIEMPGPDPLLVLQDLHRRAPEVRVIILSAYIRDRYINAAFQGGAWGYLSKSDSPTAVVSAIRTVVRGEFAIGDKVAEHCEAHRATPSSGDTPASRIDRLTSREVEILRLIGKGLSRTEIAATLHRSPKTVDNHRAALMEKLNIHRTSDLARYAISEGLAEL